MYSKIPFSQVNNKMIWLNMNYYAKYFIHIMKFKPHNFPIKVSIFDSFLKMRKMSCEKEVTGPKTESSWVIVFTCKHKGET